MSSTFNFDDIKTVSDLKEQNDDIDAPLKRVLNDLNECNYTESLFTVVYLLNNMSDFHHEQVAENEDGKNRTAYHAFNEGKVEAALSILRPALKNLLKDDEEDGE